jgi:carboxymethylenebutenolidase
MTDETIATTYGQMPAYLAEPSSPGPWPAVIVLHDASGLSNDTRRQADCAGHRLPDSRQLRRP